MDNVRLETATPRHCPFCQREFEAAGLVGHNEKLERGVFDCPEHGEIEIEWRKAEVR